MSDVPIVPEDGESVEKAAWMAESKSEIAPQVEADAATLPDALSTIQATREIDFAEGFRKYHAILSAHLPSEASAEQAIAGLQGGNLPEGSDYEIYRAGSPYVETPLAEGEVILIVRLGAEGYDQSALEQVISEAGGSKINYSPPQRLANSGLNEDSA